MFERYTDEARRALFFSRHEAMRAGGPAIDSRHLLLALLNLKSGFAKRTLGHIPVEEMRQEIGAGPQSAPGNTTAEIPFADDCQHAMQHAADEADRLGSGSIGVEHLLLGLLHIETSSGALQRHGVRLDDVRAAVVRRRLEPILFTVEEGPAPEVVFTRYDPGSHPEFAFILAQRPMEGMAGHAAVLTNRSSQRITAIAARWTAVDPAGGARTKHVVRDDYFPPQRFGWVGPGAQVLATPDGFHQALSGPHIFMVGSSGPRLDDDAVAITVALDSAVFEDGRLVGADEYDIARYLHGRHAAAMEFMRRVGEAEAAGENIDAALTRIENAARDNKDYRSWYWQWARQSTHSRPFMESLRTLPPPPQLWR